MTEQPTDLFQDFAQFESSLEEAPDTRTTQLDYPAYIKALNEYAGKRLGLTNGDYVILKPVYLHQTKIHSLIFNVCTQGKRYSARLLRRVSLGLRDRETDQWYHMLVQAYEVALENPPVGLDPKLAELPCWFESNKNSLRMTFKIGASSLTINANGIINAHGNKEELLQILNILVQKGL
jgi:hypothetical protein